MTRVRKSTAGQAPGPAPTRTAAARGRVAFVGAGPGDPGLLTRRALDLLGAADHVIADAGLDESVAALVPDAAVRGEAGATPAETAKLLVTAARTAASVVRLVHGDPLTCDEVVREALAVAKAGLTLDIVPGVPPTSGAAAYAGVAAGGTRTEADVRGALGDRTDWRALAAAPGTLVLLATARELGKLAVGLLEHGRAGDTPVVVTSGGTSSNQRSLATTLDRLESDATGLDAPAEATLVVAVGPAAATRAQLSWFESRPLYGWRVLVPRTREQAGAMSERLRRHGALPVEVPTIAVEPPRTGAPMDRALKGLVTGRYEWIVFTSTNAVKAVREKFEEFGLDARAFSGVKIAAVGEATAAAVRSFGIRPELVPSGEQSSNGLLADFPPYDDVLDPIDRVFLPRADIATETLVAGLVERGWAVDDVIAYRTVRAAPPSAPIREAIKTGGFDAVLFTSSSTVRNLVGIAGKPHPSTAVACIGPQTAATAREMGLRVDVQPETATVPDLVDALAEFASKARAAAGAQAQAGASASGSGAEPRRARTGAAAAVGAAKGRAAR